MSGIFGGGDDNKKQTVTQVSSPYPAARPGMDLFFKSATDAFKNGQLRQTPFPGETVAPVSPETAQGWQAIAARAQAGSPLTTAAGDYVSRVLSPDYLTSDTPGLQALIDKGRQGVNAEFSRAGRTFSGAHAGALGNNEDTLRYQDLVRKAGEQAGAAQFAPTLANQDYFDANQLLGVGQQRQAQLQDLINAEINRYNALQGGRASELGTFASLLGGGGPGTTSTTQPLVNNQPSPFAQALGALASLGGAYYGAGGTFGL